MTESMSGHRRGRGRRLVRTQPPTRMAGTAAARGRGWRLGLWSPFLLATGLWLLGAEQSWAAGHAVRPWGEDADPVPGASRGPAGSAPGILVDDAPPEVEERGEPDPSVETLREEVRALRERLYLLEESLATTLRALHVYEPPAAMTFAGQAVPLDRWDVRERLEREFLLSLGDRAQVVLWLKRSARYFPYIRAELRKAGLPEDLKYVAVIESALLPKAYSHASALGIWQFIAPTARRYGLNVRPWWDERRNPERSTAAAIAYLRDLHQQFKDWPLAMAGYNAGERRIEESLRRQDVSTYYQLALPAETERYVFRALAAKLVLSDPERYGFQIQLEQLYRPRETDAVELRLRTPTRVTELASAAGSFYREVMELNPEILTDQLPPGRYVIRVPKGRGAELQARLGAPSAPVEVKARAVVRYQVKRGDTLSEIAQRFGVTVGALRRWNKVAVDRGVAAGQVLVIDPGEGNDP